MTTNGDLNQQRTVSSNTGVGNIKNQGQNQPQSPSNANRAQGGPNVSSPLNNNTNANKDHKN